MEITWKLIIEDSFKDRKSLIQEIIKATIACKIDVNEQTIFVKINRPYVERLLKSNNKKVKDSYEKLADKQLLKFIVNAESFNYSLDHSKSEVDSIGIDEAIDNPIVYKTIEDSFISNSNSPLNNKKITLLFYNQFFYSTKKIEIKWRKTNFERDKAFTIILFWTLLIPLFFGLKMYIELRKRKKDLEEINELLKLKYVPLNHETKEFINFYLG